MDEPVLKVADVSKFYKRPDKKGRFAALSNVNLCIYPGKSLGLVGQSGAGKSTLARLILGMEPPSKGKIFFKNQDLSELTRKQKYLLKTKIQIIWQDPAVYLNPFYTVFQLVIEPLEVFKIGDKHLRKRRVNQLLKTVNLDPELLCRKPHELSGGQCQRVAIARALALDPCLLICDEMLSGLDIPNQAKMIRLIDSLCRETGMACLFISHDLAVVRHVCHDIAVMKDGKILEYGATINILDDPGHPYTRQLVESIRPLLRTSLLSSRSSS